MAYPYLGVFERIYGQYLNGEGGPVLVAKPGESYDPVPVQGAGTLAVPPPDGLWGSPAKPKTKTAKSPATAPDKEG